MMPCCRDVCDRATALLEGDPSGPEWEALRQHLALCPPCGEYLRQMSLTVEALRQIPGSCPEQARADLVKQFEAWARERERG